VFNAPLAVAVNSADAVFVSDNFPGAMTDPRPAVLRLDASGGAPTLLTGGGGWGYADGDSTTAQFKNPLAIAFNSVGNLLVSDGFNRVIRSVDPSGEVTTIAGTQNVDGNTDGLAATAAKFNLVYGVAVNSAGVIYTVDFLDNTVRQIS
jgi:hypothetical protein